MLITRFRTQSTKLNYCLWTDIKKYFIRAENTAPVGHSSVAELPFIPSSSKRHTLEQTKENIISVNGINVNFRAEGEGRHTVLLLPGLVGTIDTDFGLLFKHMNKSKFHLVSMEPPGYGKSRPYLRDHHGDYYARDAEVALQLMDRLGYDKFSVMGWSNGGITGNTMAALFPKRVEKLVMIGSIAYFDDDSVPRGLAVANTGIWSRRVLKRFHEIYEPTYLEEMLENYHKSNRELLTSGNYKVVMDRHSKVQCPTFVFHGDRDPIVLMTHAHFYGKSIKNCTVHIAAGGKHNAHMTHTQEFLNLVEPFLLNNCNTSEHNDISANVSKKRVWLKG